MDGLVEDELGRHPKLANDFPVLIIEAEITDTGDAIGVKTIDRNVADVAATADSIIVHTPGVCSDNGANYSWQI